MENIELKKQTENNEINIKEIINDFKNKKEICDKKIITPIEVIDYLFINDLLLTNNKTQKIIYFFFKKAFHENKINKDDYVDENDENKINLFEAWKNGPINLKSYYRFFELQNNIEEEDIVFGMEKNRLIINELIEKGYVKGKVDQNLSELSKMIIDIYNFVHDYHKNDLIEFSHDWAWKNARELNNEKNIPSYKPFSRKIIKNADIYNKKNEELIIK